MDTAARKSIGARRARGVFTRETSAGAGVGAGNKFFLTVDFLERVGWAVVFFAMRCEVIRSARRGGQSSWVRGERSETMRRKPRARGAELKAGGGLWGAGYGGMRWDGGGGRRKSAAILCSLRALMLCAKSHFVCFVVNRVDRPVRRDASPYWRRRWFDQGASAPRLCGRRGPRTGCTGSRGERKRRPRK